jgi:ABC-type multidrug transport system permease subunit
MARNAFRALFIARSKELSREPAVLFWDFVFPLLLALALGLVRVQSGDVVHVAVVRGTGASVVDALAATPGVRVLELDAAAAGEWQRRGRAALVVSFEDGRLTYRYQADRQEGLLARALVHAAIQNSAAPSYAIPVHDRPVTAKGFRYIDFLVPGILALSLMNGGLFGVGFALVNLRIRNVLKTLAATPMAKRDFLAALLGSRLMLVLLQVISLLVGARLIFGMPVLGSPAVIALVAVAGSTTFAALGMTIAARAKTLHTVNGAINLVMLPMFIFSGVFFSTDRFPAVLQPLVKVLPLTALTDALRSTVTQRATIADISTPLAILGVWAAIFFCISLRLFRWA